MAIRKIEIYRVAENDFAVIADGDRCDRLTWEEMLGQVAQLSMKGTPRFRDSVLSPWFFEYRPKLLLQENPKV